MPFTMYDSEGNPIAGDMNNTKNMRDFADERGAHIKDDKTGQVVHGKAPDHAQNDKEV
jgi:hypothetical protein